MGHPRKSNRRLFGLRDCDRRWLLDDRLAAIRGLDNPPRVKQQTTCVTAIVPFAASVTCVPPNQRVIVSDNVLRPVAIDAKCREFAEKCRITGNFVRQFLVTVCLSLWPAALFVYHENRRKGALLFHRLVVVETAFQPASQIL
ncbi:hypothetical protein CA54_04710 [Symmachiella macrocystis]|uniref:Uncharacterized protein n=1 Tax=Symmachiella macrocystis TaxID=2527985 RepID=A0A5C6BHN2_9PLAN|nr:hypothetical protein CA54_04710 [Symmachiella macrocystis]